MGGEGKEGERREGRGGMTVIHIILMDHNIYITTTSRRIT